LIWSTGWVSTSKALRGKYPMILCLICYHATI
jgi:hypothetical protein